MAIGLELARVLMEQSVSEQATHMPAEDLDCAEETAQRAGTGRADLKTQVGVVEHDIRGVFGLVHDPVTLQSRQHIREQRVDTFGERCQRAASSSSRNGQRTSEHARSR